MKIRFCGAARSVTGSCHMITFEGGSILVDCGMRQGEDAHTDYGEGDFPFIPSDIKALLITHAHIDHTGMVPLLVKRGFNGPIFSTEATAKLCGIMLPDSAHIQEQDAEYQNRKNERAGKPLVEPLYTAQDAENSLRLFKGVRYDSIIQICPGVEARFTDVGHLLGSAAIEVWVTEGGKKTRIVFSGDIGRDDRPIIKDPESPEGADYLVLESTYGDRLHTVSTDDEKEQEFAEILREGIARGGNIVIPAFAVGRTQELLYYIKRFLVNGTVPGLEKVPVYIDSPLGIKATRIYAGCGADCYDDETKALARSGDLFEFDSLHIAETVEQSMEINELTGCNIIISASGMCEAGRIRHHLKNNLYKANATVVFVGYQAEGSLGWKLENGAKSVKLFGEDIAVNAEIAMLHGTSGHADKEGLLAWLAGFREKPKMVFVNHGDDSSCKAFCATMQKRKKEVSHMDEAIAQRCIAEARYMLRHRTTIRQTAAAFQLSKSGIHKDMLQHLPQADAALAREVSALLAYNKSVRHLRGGEATRRRYAQEKSRKSAECLQFPENTLY